jgi:hypothetical protein
MDDYVLSGGNNTFSALYCDAGLSGAIRCLNSFQTWQTNGFKPEEFVGHSVDLLETIQMSSDTFLTTGNMNVKMRTFNIQNYIFFLRKTSTEPHKSFTNVLHVLYEVNADPLHVIERSDVTLL